ncbi:hypothetical protein GGX14DRAFT_581384 [Mycena pura]|uniref:Uncharacterized protein n=1 Tax=Mycena pura TaxID=153505 RepID=A0AAD6YUM0_9AGAR|nr:hypothetical protein GGX14DRAFT_581384 [Mycena pura]
MPCSIDNAQEVRRALKSPGMVRQWFATNQRSCLLCTNPTWDRRASGRVDKVVVDRNAGVVAERRETKACTKVEWRWSPLEALANLHQLLGKKKIKFFLPHRTDHLHPASDPSQPHTAVLFRSGSPSAPILKGRILRRAEVAAPSLQSAGITTYRRMEWTQTHRSARGYSAAATMLRSSRSGRSGPKASGARNWIKHKSLGSPNEKCGTCEESNDQAYKARKSEREDRGCTQTRTKVSGSKPN